MMAEDKAYESWKYLGAGRISLLKYNQKGELAGELIPGGKVFQISPQERRINQEMAAGEDLDFFRNGQLAPVRLLDTDDAAELASNPNVMSETDMRSLFKTNWKNFDSRIQEVSNTSTLERLVQIAKEVDATVRQLEIIESRLDELKPSDELPISGSRAVMPG